MDVRMQASKVCCGEMDKKLRRSNFTGDEMEVLIGVE